MAGLKSHMAKAEKKFREISVPKILKEVEEEWKEKRPIIVETEQGLAVMTVAEARRAGLKEKSFDRDGAQGQEQSLPMRSKDGEGK